MVLDSILFRALNAGSTVGSDTELGSHLANLEGTGLFELVLPFLLVFAIVYGILEELDLFDNNKPSVIIALVIATFAAVFFPMGQWLAFLEGPWVMWLILILMVLITLELVGLGPEESRWTSRIVGLVAILGVLALFLLDPSVLEAIFGVDLAGGGVSLAGIPVIGPIIESIGLGTIILLIVAGLLIAWMADLLPGGGG